MANFSTHINAAAMVSGVGAMSLVYAGMIDKNESFILFFAGIIGGILPDIDHDKSTPLKIMEFFFGNLIAFLVVFKYIGIYTVPKIVLLWVFSYICVSLAFYVFKKFTHHRGMFHSVTSAFLFMFLTTDISYYFFNLTLSLSYYTGLFVFAGYMTHLILDEIYSVDIAGVHIKQSFGSALKFFSNSKTASAAFFAVMSVLCYILPQKEYLLNLFGKVF
jgi:hypothetical protein